MPSEKPPERPKKNLSRFNSEQRNLILIAKIKELEEAVIQARLKNDQDEYNLFHRELITHLLDLYAAIGSDTRTRKPDGGKPQRP